ncbi:MAG TPA: hypothetical protein VE090_06400 [Methylomirabilota bacterium]|nr:hypothetical protein [Methylomirabilota bacterium]
MNVERLRVALPGGELQGAVLQKVIKSGFELDTSNPKKYLIGVDKLPLDLVIIRASSVPEIVNDKKSVIKAGITGSDILWEAGMGKTAGNELPIPSKSALFLGVTEALQEKIEKNYRRKIEKTDLSGSIVVTKFPKIAGEVLNDISDIEILYAPGKTEAKQYVYPNCNGIIDVVSEGDTIKANRLRIIEKILDPVTVRFIAAEEKLTERDREVLVDFRNRISTA